MIERLSFQQELAKPFAYNPFLDRESFLKTGEKEKLSPYTRRQLETHIGERFNVLLSTIRYDIKGGHLYGQNLEEPAIEAFTRGIGRTGSTEEDIEREKAEVVGFAQIDKDFVSSSAKIGDKIVSISPPSGSYKHNFYDVFTLQGDGQGRYVEMRRYSSGLTISETVQKFKDASLVGEDYETTPEHSLSHPIKIESDKPGFKTADDIHNFLHKDHKFTSREVLDQIIKICTPLITSYINTLSNNPLDTQTQILNYNAILRQAEIAYDAIEDNDQRFVRDLILKSQFQLPTKADILFLGTQQVRPAMIGCGFSASFKIPGMEQINSPFSVADKDPKKSSEKQILCCTCPFCEKQVEAEIGGGKITCPNCNKSASWS